MYVNFLSTYSDKKSCHTSTTLQTSIARFVSHIWASCSTTDKYWTISFPCVGRLYVKQCKFNKLTLCRNWCEANKVYKVKDANCRKIFLKWLRDLPHELSLSFSQNAKSDYVSESNSNAVRPSDTHCKLRSVSFLTLAWATNLNKDTTASKLGLKLGYRPTQTLKPAHERITPKL